MKKPQALITLFCIYFIFVSFPAQAQSSKDSQARAQYDIAQDAYDNKRYDEALTALKKTEKLLGETKPLLSALKIKSYIGLGHFVSAKYEMNVFFSLESDKSLSDEISSYVKVIDNGILANKGPTTAELIPAFKHKLQNFTYDKTGKPNLAEASRMINFLNAELWYSQGNLVIGSVPGNRNISIWTDAYGFKSCYSVRFGSNLKSKVDTSYHKSKETYFEICKKIGDSSPYFDRKKVQ